MQERSIFESLLKEVTRDVDHIVADQPAGRAKGIVTALSIALGPHSGVDPARRRSAFNLARMGRLAEVAVLRIDPVAGTVWCPECEIASTVPSNPLVFDLSGAWRVNLRLGTELTLRSITLSGHDGPVPKDGTRPVEKTNAY